MVRKLHWLLMAAAWGGPWGCSPSETGAREEFAHQYSCPRERVSARERTDIVPSTGAPPPDVAGDPDRLALWRSDALKRMDTRPVFEATGCGRSELYRCWLWSPSATESGVAHTECVKDTTLASEAAPPPLPATIVAPVPSSTAAPEPESKALAAGCSKDTDCKGDRICVRGQCTDPPAR
jgi:hypothetical protein